MNFGIMFMPFGVAAFIGPRLAASIKVASGSYSNAFLIGSILCVVGIAFSVMARQMLKKRMAETTANAKQFGLQEAGQVS